MCLFIILGLVALFTSAIPAVPNPMISPAMLVLWIHAVSIGGAIISAICVFFYWKGHEWARWLVMIDAVLILLLLFGVAKTWQLSHFNGSVQIGRALLAIYLLWYLNTAPVRSWFKGPKSGELAA